MTYAYLASEKPLTSHGIFSEVPTAPTRVEPTVLGHPWEGSRGSGKQTHEQWLLNPCWLMISSGIILYYTTLYILGILIIQ